MLKKLVIQIKELSQEKRHIMTLFWIQTFASTTTGLFVGIFVFLETQSVAFLILYSMVFHFAIFIGFVGFGYLFSRVQKSLKMNYLYSFVLFFVSFIWIANIEPSLTNILIFAIVNGIGSGIFWLTNHSYEMIYTKNENGDRDFYSSIEHAGKQIINVSAILIGTILIFLAEKVFNIETFTLLFWFLPLVFLASLPFLFSLPHYIPEKTSLKGMFSFLKIKRKRKIAWYYLLSNDLLATIAVTLFSVIALESALRIGSWESIVSIIALVATLALANFRREDNRITIMKYAVIGYIAAYGLLLFSEVSLYFYIAFTLLVILLQPIYRVSQHTIDLHSLEILIDTNEKSTFFPGLLGRESILMLRRMINLGIALTIALVLNDNILTAKILIIMYLVMIVVNWFMARYITKT